MKQQVNIGTVYAANAAILKECAWLLEELAKLEQQGLDEGRGPDIRQLTTTLQETARYDVGGEIDCLASRLGQPGANVRAPAGMIIRWLHQDIRPLANLAAPAFKEGARPTPLLHLLMVVAGELMTHWSAICDELKQIEPDPFGPIPAEVGASQVV